MGDHTYNSIFMAKNVLFRVQNYPNFFGFLSKGWLNLWARYSEPQKQIPKIFFPLGASIAWSSNLCAAEFPHYNSDPVLNGFHKFQGSRGLNSCDHPVAPWEAGTSSVFSGCLRLLSGCLRLTTASTYLILVHRHIIEACKKYTITCHYRYLHSRQNSQNGSKWAKIGQNLAFIVLKSTLARKKYTTAGCGGCD